MTSFNGVFQPLLKSRLRLVGTYLLVLVLAAIVVMLFGDTTTQEPMKGVVKMFIAAMVVNAPLAGVILYFWLARQVELTWTNRAWRSIPISNAKLYAAHLLANIVAMVTFLVAIAALTLVATRLAGSWPDIQTELPKGVTNAHMVWLAATFSLFLWSFITALHLVANAIGTRLPRVPGGWLQRALLVVVIVLGFVVFNWLSTAASAPFAGVAKAHLGAAVLVIGGLLLLAWAGLAVLNVFLLNRLVGADQMAK